MVPESTEYILRRFAGVMHESHCLFRIIRPAEKILEFETNFRFSCEFTKFEQKYQHHEQQICQVTFCTAY
jgi:hypothetical protein